MVEDDPSSGKVLKEALTREGYTVKVCNRPGEVERVFALGDFQLLIVDCMLPKISGVDLVEQLQKNFDKDFHVLLVSGVFKNSAFSKEAVRRVKAAGFFFKPFDLEALFESVYGIFESELEDEKDPLYELLASSKVSKKELLEAINETETIQGKDLPLLYGLLFHSNISGILNLIDMDGQASALHFSEGNIVEVNVQDKTSYFGVLLIENGFTSAEEVEQNLSLDDKRPIGVRLVDAHALSPHAIKIALTQQMSIRLSKTIQENSYTVNFVESNISEKQSKITSLNFHSLLSDWIDSKLSRDWLLQFYLPWMDYRLVEVENNRLFQEVKDLPLLRVCPEVFKYSHEGKTLSELLDETRHSQYEVLAMLHFLVIVKLIKFEMDGNTQVDYNHKIKTIRKMLDGIEQKDLFQRLGLNQKARAKEINRVYMDLVKVLHPDRLPSSAPEELHELQNKIFSYISDAYKTLSDPDERDKYLKELSWGKAELAFETENKINKGVGLLSQGRYTEAYQLFKALDSGEYRRPDIPIYLSWALLKLPTSPEKKKKVIKKATVLLKRVPPEERHNAVFFLVKGLFYLKTDNEEKAIVNFKNARTLDPTLMEAKRELLALKQRHKQENTTFIHTIFKKKA